MAGNISRIIDALAADITAQRTALGLPSFTTLKYVRPLMDDPGHMPALGVFITTNEAEVETTMSGYSNDAHLSVVWYENFMESLDNGSYDSVKFKTFLDRSEKILMRLETFGDGLTAAGFSHDLTVGRSTWGRVAQGGIFACETKIVVESWTP